jgi:kynurenine 3-monooxygenase
MREDVLDARFQLQKALALQLERRHPGRFIPRYAMVMFHAEIPYATALSRGRIQQQVLDEATHAGSVDLALADRLVRERLAPIA